MGLPSKLDYFMNLLIEQGANDLANQLEGAKHTDSECSSRTFNNVMTEANNRGLNTYLNPDNYYQWTPRNGVVTR